MAKTLTQIKNERLKYLKGLKPILRKLDAAVEKAERELLRMTKRKITYPEPADLAKIATLLEDVTKNLSIATVYLGKGFVE